MDDDWYDKWKRRWTGVLDSVAKYRDAQYRKCPLFEIPLYRHAALGLFRIRIKREHGKESS